MKNLILLSCFTVFIALIGCGKKAETKINETLPDTTTKKKEVVKNDGVMTGTLTLSKTEVEPGEEISLDFKAEGTIGTNAWIGLIPSNVEHGSESNNDKYDLSYQYLGDKTSGTMTFTAPTEPGQFDFRMNSTDSDGKEVASVTFTVKGAANTKSEMSIDKKSYAKGEKIVLTFKAPTSWEKQAWIGLVPAATKHGFADDADKVDVAYKYIEGKSKGSFEFKAPQQVGKYSFRMFDAYRGKEAKSVDFTVE